MVGLGLVMWIFLVLFIVLSAAIGGATLCSISADPHHHAKTALALCGWLAACARRAPCRAAGCLVPGG